MNLSIEPYFNLPVDSRDLGSIGKGLFTQRKRINIDALAPRQTEICAETLKLKLKGKLHTQAFVVICSDGSNILIDGHHTVIAKRLNGQKYIIANCYHLITQ